MIGTTSGGIIPPRVTRLLRSTLSASPDAAWGTTGKGLRLKRLAVRKLFSVSCASSDVPGPKCRCAGDVPLRAACHTLGQPITCLSHHDRDFVVALERRELLFCCVVIGHESPRRGK